MCPLTYAVNRMFVYLSSPQQKQQEIERVEKWLKMVKNWDKYRNSDKVNNHTPTYRFNLALANFFFFFFTLSYVMNYFHISFLICFPFPL